MCGIVGIAGNLSQRDEVTMRRMLMLDFFRGPDATGLAAIRNNGEVKIAKLASDPVTLFGANMFVDALNGNKSRCFIGHNRFATRGGKTHYNAHPFEFEHIIGAHNGTLDTASWNRLEDVLGQKFGVDSQALIAAIAKLGIKDAIELCNHGSDSTTGAWSLVWYDMFEGTLNFLRNEHRPMWLAYNKAKDGFDRILWASQWPMIDAATRLSELGYDIYKDKEGFGFFPTDEDVHYKFDVGLFVTGSDKAMKPKVRKIKGREPVKAVITDNPFPKKITAENSAFGFHSTATGRSSTISSTTQQGKSCLGTTRPSQSQVISLLGTPKAPLGNYLSAEQFETLMRPSGGAACQWCDTPLTAESHGMTIFERDAMLLCAEHSCHGDETRIYIPKASFDARL